MWGFLTALNRFFVLFDVSSTEESYQNMDPNQGYQGSSSQSVSRDFWETFGSNTSLKAKKSPSSDSWTVADNSAKKSSDSWDNWGSEAASNNKHSTEESWEAWDNNWENAGGKSKKSPTKPAEESWDNAGWWPGYHASPFLWPSFSFRLFISLALWGASSARFPSVLSKFSISKLIFLQENWLVSVYFESPRRSQLIRAHMVRICPDILVLMEN